MIYPMIAVGAIMYLIMAGFFYPKIFNHYNKTMYRGDATTLAFFSAAAWPAVLPIAMGRAVSTSNFTYVPRQEVKNQKEIQQAQHKLEIARIRAEELAIKEKEAGIT